MTGQKFEWTPFRSLRCRSREHAFRGRKSPSWTFDEFGATVGCPGCNAIKDNKRAQAHSDRCKKRIEECLRNTPHGAERLDRRDEVINEALAEEVRRGEQRKKRSDGTTAAVPETGSTAPEPMAGSAAPEFERRSHRTRPESREENAHEVNIIDVQRQWSAKGEETNPRWRIEDAS